MPRRILFVETFSVPGVELFQKGKSYEVEDPTATSLIAAGVASPVEEEAAPATPEPTPAPATPEPPKPKGRGGKIG